MDYKRIYDDVLLRATKRARKDTYEDFRCPLSGASTALKPKEHSLMRRILYKLYPSDLAVLHSYIEYLHHVEKDTRLRWITNGTVDRRIVTSASLPFGYQYGRKVRLQRLADEAAAKQKKEDDKIMYWTEQYDLYNRVGYDLYCIETGYNRTQQNLIASFRRYAEGYTPQAGKRRAGWYRK